MRRKHEIKLNDAAGWAYANDGEHHDAQGAQAPHDDQEEGAGEELNDDILQCDISNTDHDDHPHNDVLASADQHDTRVCTPDPRDARGRKP